MISRGDLLSISAARASQSSWAAGGASTAAAFTACGRASIRNAKTDGCWRACGSVPHTSPIEQAAGGGKP